MKKLSLTQERKTLFYEMFLEDKIEKNEKLIQLEHLVYPEDYDGKRIYKNFYEFHGDKFTDIEKVISFLIIWCTGDIYWEEYEVESQEELHDEEEKERWGNVSYADIVMFEEKKTIVFYEIYG